MKLQVCEGLELVQFKDEVLAIDQQGGKVLSLNAVAKEVLDCIDGTKSLEEIAKEIAQEYETNEQQILEDVREFLMGVIELGLVEQC